MKTTYKIPKQSVALFPFVAAERISTYRIVSTIVQQWHGNHEIEKAPTHHKSHTYTRRINQDEKRSVYNMCNTRTQKEEKKKERIAYMKVKNHTRKKEKNNQQIHHYHTDSGDGGNTLRKM